jgi:hypothetical protein
MKRRKGRVPDHLRKSIALAVHPSHWLKKAQHLKEAADGLFPSFQQTYNEFLERFERERRIDWAAPDDSSIVLLLAFSIENLLKGLCASTSEHSNVKELKQLALPSRSHELVPLSNTLAKDLDIYFDEQELDLLHVLEHYILWAGRYPSPRSIDDLIPTHDTGQFKKFYLNYPGEYIAVFRLYDRLEQALSQRIKNLPPPPPKVESMS